jgi:hypothetical protein
MIPRIIGCCALQIIEGRTDLATEMANPATSRGSYVVAAQRLRPPVHQRVLQHPQTPFISGRH